MILGKDSSCFTEQVGDYVIVGKYSSIAKGCRFHEQDNHHCIRNKKAVRSGFYGLMYTRGPITIGNDVWIGEGVRILDGITIHDGAIIGAGAVITKDVPPYAVVVGNPGIITRFRFTPEQIMKLQQIKWWDWETKDILEREKDFEDIDLFIKKYA